MTSRTDVFMSRAVKHLATLSSNAARRAWLTEQIDTWEERRKLFVESVDAGTYEGTATIWDYTDTLFALQSELARYRRATEAA